LGVVFVVLLFEYFSDVNYLPELCILDIEALYFNRSTYGTLFCDWNPYIYDVQ